jgi:hypothetical protein
VGEVDVPGRVDQVELVHPAVPGGVRQRDGVRLDGDPAFPFEVHGVEDLVAELPVLHRAAALDEAVGQRGLAVVDVGDDAEVADVVHGPLELRPTSKERRKRQSSRDRPPRLPVDLAIRRSDQSEGQVVERVVGET